MCERRIVMAETKKTVNVTPAAKAVAAQAADTKTEEAKTTSAASAEESKKAPAKKTAGRKTTAKKTTTRKTAAAKKTTTAKTTTKAPAKKTAVKEALHIQFSGKSYTTEDLVKIAKDVWKYDLKQKVGDFKSVELYVKPEEQVVYYVINGEVSGSFGI